MDIYHKIIMGVYDNKYKVDPIKKKCFKCYENLGNVNFCPYCGEPFAEKYALKKEEHLDQIKIQREKDIDLMDRFRKDAIKHCGLSCHPKACKAFDYAWIESHSSGYADVVSTLEDLSDLII